MDITIPRLHSSWAGTPLHMPPKILWQLGQYHLVLLSAEGLLLSSPLEFYWALSPPHPRGKSGPAMALLEIHLLLPQGSGKAPSPSCHISALLAQ